MPTHGPRLTMHQHAQAYLDVRRHQLARSSRDQIACTLDRFAGWWDGTRKVPRSMREHDVQRYIWGPHACAGERCKGRQHHGPGLSSTLSAATLNGNLGRLRLFLEWACRRGLVLGETVDATTERARVGKKRRLRLDHARIVDLYEGAEDPYHRWICALCVYTAGRGSELLTLRISDLDLDSGELVWSRHKTGDDADVLPVVAELEAEARRWLTHYREAMGGVLKPSWLLVPRRQQVGAPPTGYAQLRPTEQRVAGLHMIVKPNLARVLGCDITELRGEGVHTARRSMARLLYERLRRDHHADPISVVQALLGHANRSMTERYIGVESGRQERDRLLRGRAMLGED